MCIRDRLYCAVTHRVLHSCNPSFWSDFKCEERHSIAIGDGEKLSQKNCLGSAWFEFKTIQFFLLADRIDCLTDDLASRHFVNANGLPDPPKNGR